MHHLTEIEETTPLPESVTELDEMISKFWDEYHNGQKSKTEKSVIVSKHNEAVEKSNKIVGWKRIYKI